MKQVSQFLYRGARPKSLEELQSASIRAIVDLESGAYEILHDDWYEFMEAPTPECNIVRWKIPLSDIFAPNFDNVRTALEIVQYFTAKGQNVLVHCLHGNDRTGFVIAAYRMQVDGWSYRDAVREMLDEGFHWFPYFAWLVPLIEWRFRKIT